MHVKSLVFDSNTNSYNRTVSRIGLKKKREKLFK